MVDHVEAPSHRESGDEAYHEEVLSHEEPGDKGHQAKGWEYQGHQALGWEY